MTTFLRPRPVSALLGPLMCVALAVGVSACSNEADVATDPAGTASPSQTPSQTPSETASETPTATPSEDAGPTTIPATGSAGVTEATLVHATDAGGSPSGLAYVIDSPQALTDFGAGLAPALVDQVSASIEQLDTPDSLVYAAVVAVGCDAPESVTIDAGEAGLQVEAQLPKETVQCVAPVTYAVVFAAPSA